MEGQKIRRVPLSQMNSVLIYLDTCVLTNNTQTYVFYILTNMNTYTHMQTYMHVYTNLHSRLQ